MANQTGTCPNCDLCGKGAIGSGVYKAGRATLATATLGASAAVKAMRSKCPVCQHPMSKHDQTDVAMPPPKSVPPPPGAMPTPAASPSWLPDPTGRFEHRWWDGGQWTGLVANGGQQATDPTPVVAPTMPAPAPAPVAPRAPALTSFRAQFPHPGKLPWTAKHGELRDRFKNMGTIAGRSREEIEDAVGPPTSISYMNRGEVLLQWQQIKGRRGFHVSLIFDSEGVCGGVKHQSG